MLAKILCPLRRMALWLCTLTVPFVAAQELSLNQAIEKTLTHNPSLQAFAVKKQALQQQRQTQGLAPPLALGLEVENILGTGNSQGLDNGEYTLSLSSVIELGDKADARVASVEQEHTWLNAKQKVAALDAVSDVSNSYILALGYQQQWLLAKAQVSLSEKNLKAIQKRHQAGLLSAAELARSQADLAKAKLMQRQYFYQLQSQKDQLAGFWGETKGGQYQLNTQFFYQQPAIKNKATLLQQLQQSPLLEALSQQERLSQAYLQQSRAESSSDISWSLGVKKQQAEGDYSISAGISMPLFSKRRNHAKIQQRIAEQQQIGLQKQQQLIVLQQQLNQRYQQYQIALETASALQETIIPALARALKTIHQGYLQGRFGYLEWADIQKQLLSAKQNYIENHTQAWLIRNDIERITGLTSQQITRNMP